MSLSELKNYFGLPGVRDLPSKVRLHLAKALRAEKEGNTEEAELSLTRAIQEEEALAAF